MAGLSRDDLEGLTKACLVDPEDEEAVFCHICLDIYEDPTQVPCPNQHVACRACLEPWVQANGTCPTCRAEIRKEELYRMRHVVKNMPKVQVYCPHRCGYQGPLSTFRQHKDRCPQHLDNRIGEELNFLQNGVQDIDEEMRELQEDRARLVQEQERLQQLRQEIQEAVRRGEVPAAMEDPGHQVRHQETGREALRRQVTDLQQALASERTQRQAGAIELERVRQELANHQSQDQARRRVRRRIAESEEVAPSNRYASLSQAEQERNNKQLRAAAQMGNVSEVSRLLNEGLVDANGQEDDGWTALHWASAKGHVDVVERLLQARANPNQADNRGRTPLSIACMVGNSAAKPEIERLLRQAGGW